MMRITRGVFALWFLIPPLTFSTLKVKTVLDCVSSSSFPSCSAMKSSRWDCDWNIMNPYLREDVSRAREIWRGGAEIAFMEALRVDCSWLSVRNSGRFVMKAVWGGWGVSWGISCVLSWVFLGLYMLVLALSWALRAFLLNSKASSLPVQSCREVGSGIGLNGIGRSSSYEYFKFVIVLS